MAGELGGWKRWNEGPGGGCRKARKRVYLWGRKLLENVHLEKVGHGDERYGGREHFEQGLVVQEASSLRYQVVLALI